MSTCVPHVIIGTCYVASNVARYVMLLASFEMFPK